MRRSWLVVAVALTGCEDRVVIEVVPDPQVPVSQVELYLGLGACPTDQCPGIKPETPTLSRAILPGTVFYRDDDGTKDTLIANVSDGVATFEIHASSAGAHLDAAVAVDPDGRSAALIRDLDLVGAHRYRVDLRAAGAILGPKLDTTTGQFVQIWRQLKGNASACIGFERWTDGRLDGREFIVPRDDLDCDDLPDEIDCNNLAHNSFSVPTPEVATCVVNELVDPIGVCKLGGPSCIDASPMGESCSASDYCIPNAFCQPANTPCATTTDHEALKKCLFQTPSPARLRCSVPFKPSGDGTHLDACTGVRFDITDRIDVQCVGPDGQLLMRAPPAGQALSFDDTIELGSSTGTAQDDVLEVTARHESDCAYKLELNGSKGTTGELESSFIRFAIARPGGAVSFLLLPLEIEAIADPTCSRPAACAINIAANTDLLRCAH